MSHGPTFGVRISLFLALLSAVLSYPISGVAAASAPTSSVNARIAKGLVYTIAPHCGVLAIAPQQRVANVITTDDYVPGDECIRTFSVSPDHTELAVEIYEFASRGAGIGVVNLSTNTLTMLTTAKNQQSPKWSPDGSWIAWQSSNGCDEGLKPRYATCIMHPDGTEKHVLYPGPSLDEGGWTDTDKFIARGSHGQTLLVRPNGTVATTLRIDPGIEVEDVGHHKLLTIQKHATIFFGARSLGVHGDSATLSPNQRWIAYISTNHQRVMIVKTNGRRAHVINPGGSIGLGGVEWR